MKNLRLLVLGLLVLGGFGLVTHVCHADGNVQAGLNLPSGGGQYLYPTTAAPKAGGVLVQDGVQNFQWSNAPVVTVTPQTANQLVSITSMTLTQVAQTTPTVVGQLVFCGNCVTGNNAVGLLCMSTTTANAQNAFVGISSATAITACK